MTRTPALAAAAAAGLLAACGIAGPAAAVGTQATDSPAAAFLKAIHQGNLSEILAGQDARGSATTACVKRVGAVLVRDHAALENAVRTLAGKLHLTLPPGAGAALKKEFAKIKANAGTRSYDAGWLRMQAVGHQQALALLDREISSADRTDLAAAARVARPIVARHLAMLQACGMPAPALTASPAPATMPPAPMPPAPATPAAAAPGPVQAGLGGAANRPADRTLPLLAAGTALAVSGAGWALRRRRADSGR